jgi:hypothetical protein
LKSELCNALVDSGATHSFVSRQFCIDHHFRFAKACSQALLADNTTQLPVVGVMWNASLQIRSFSCKQSFLVLDVPDLSLVLGMDWLRAHNPVVKFYERTMEFRTRSRSLIVPALSTDPQPNCSSSRIELCTIDAFARSLRNTSTIDASQVVLAVLQHIPDVPVTLSGPGADSPNVKPLLLEFSDVLVPEIPGGLPPERYATDGRPIECAIDVEPDAKPYARPPRTFSPEETQEIRNYLDEFLSKGWITPSLSPWAAPVLFVPKKLDPVTGQRSWRMCVSYVKLNSKTLNRIAYRLPRISELLARVSRSKYFSKFDLLSGFYQIRMRSSDIAKTGFSTPFGNFEFKVMPMGLCGAPGTFQHLMDDTFAKPITINGKTLTFLDFICIYLDDICVHSTTEHEHLLHLRAVLTRLREQKLYAKPTKCEWMRTEIEFLGHIVGPTGLSIASSKVDALQQWPAPKSLADLRSLLGTFGFWRAYIRNYAGITYPLTELTRKSVAWHWGVREQQALLDLKRAMRDSPVLMPANHERPFFIVTDASDYAVGASLEQVDDQRDARRPITYLSHLLNPAERNYPTHERELLAIVLALRTWRHFLLGSEFSVICQTDHRPLQSFLSQTTLSARQVRWQQFLSEFNLQVTYLPGKVNTFADGLSRVRLRVATALAPYDDWLSRINAAVEACPEAHGLKRKSLNLHPKDESDAYVLLHDVLFWRSKGTMRVYVPASLRSQLMHEFHDIHYWNGHGVESGRRG